MFNNLEDKKFMAKLKEDYTLLASIWLKKYQDTGDKRYLEYYEKLKGIYETVKVAYSG